MRLTKTTLTIAAILLAAQTGWSVIEAGHLGSIRDGLSAPTSVTADATQIAILEPFLRQLIVLTVDGRLTNRLDIEGDAIGLARYSNSEYLYCDRARRIVVITNIESGSQEPLLASPSDVLDPIDIVVEQTTCYILDAGGKTIVTVGHDRAVRSRFALVAGSGASIVFPSSFAYDHQRAMFYVLDQQTSEIHMFSSAGVWQGRFSSFGGEDGAITRGGEIVCDQSGSIYIADRYQGRVVVFASNRTFVGNIEVAAGKDRMAIPTGLAIDPEGVLYVASTEGQRIDLFHLGRPDIPSATLLAAPAYPIDYDTIGVADARLLAYATSLSQGTIVAGIDFQLFTVDDPNTPIAEVLNVPLRIMPEEQTQVAEWQIGKRLAGKTTYAWRARGRSAAQVGDWSDIVWFVTASVPREFSLAQNYPNPFNPRTEIPFVLPTESGGTLAVYNLIGQEVWRYAFDLLPAGSHQVSWDGTDQGGQSLASGVYFYRLTAGQHSKTRKMVLLK